MTTVYYPGPIPPDIPNRKASTTAQWLRDIKAALHDMQYMTYMLHGGVDGVYGCGTTPADSMKVVPTSPASLAVSVNPGVACAFEAFIRKTTTTAVTTLTTAVTNPKIYLIQYNLNTRFVTWKCSAEAASPITPTADTYNIPLATVYMRVGAAHIDATDDTVNGYITDARVFVNL